MMHPEGYSAQRMLGAPAAGRNTVRSDAPYAPPFVPNTMPAVMLREHLARARDDGVETASTSPPPGRRPWPSRRRASTRKRGAAGGTFSTASSPSGAARSTDRRTARASGLPLEGLHPLGAPGDLVLQTGQHRVGGALDRLRGAAETLLVVPPEARLRLLTGTCHQVRRDRREPERLQSPTARRPLGQPVADTPGRGQDIEGRNHLRELIQRVLGGTLDEPVDQGARRSGRGCQSARG